MLTTPGGRPGARPTTTPRGPSAAGPSTRGRAAPPAPDGPSEPETDRTRATRDSFRARRSRPGPTSGPMGGPAWWAAGRGGATAGGPAAPSGPDAAGGPCRRREPRPGATGEAGGSAPGGAAGPAAGGAAGPAGGRAGGSTAHGSRRPGSDGRRGRPKATLGSTSYDDAPREPEPAWNGATWYGDSSGTYWTINPKEYADPRKHGPEYLARARRGADLASKQAPPARTSQMLPNSADARAADARFRPFQRRPPGPDPTPAVDPRPIARVPRHVATPPRARPPMPPGRHHPTSNGDRPPAPSRPGETALRPAVNVRRRGRPPAPRALLVQPNPPNRPGATSRMAFGPTGPPDDRDDGNALPSVRHSHPTTRPAGVDRLAAARPLRGAGHRRGDRLQPLRGVLHRTGVPAGLAGPAGHRRGPAPPALLARAAAIASGAVGIATIGGAAGPDRARRCPRADQPRGAGLLLAILVMAYAVGLIGAVTGRITLPARLRRSN